MKKNTAFADTCNIHCTDNKKTMEVDILDFKPQQFLSVSVNKSIRLNLKYMDNQELYVGSMAGLEFTTKGPKRM